MAQKFTNAARSPLMANISDIATSLTVDIALCDLFPIADTGTDPVPTIGKDWFKIVLQNNSGQIEIVYVRTRTLGSPNMTNLLRGQEGTTARAYLAGSIVGLRHTALDLEDAITFAGGASAFWKTLVGWTTAALSRVALGATTVGDALFTAVDAAAARATLGVTSEIQPISASVAATELTISASELTLAFRSTTGTSGAVTRVTGTPAPLVISSGSTLGTASGVVSYIYVLALNVGGVIELAAFSSPSAVYDETGTINTTAEGGAGLADSANTAYSTTARSNVSYRVIGYLKSNQSVAGIWISPPDVQGAGGQALLTHEAPSSWATLTPFVLGTTYTNRSTKRIFIDAYGTYTAGAATSWTIGGFSGLGRTVNTGAASATMSTQITVARGQTFALILGAGSVTSVNAAATQ